MEQRTPSVFDYVSTSSILHFTIRSPKSDITFPQFISLRYGMPHYVSSCLTASYALIINILSSLKSDIEFVT